MYDVPSNTGSNDKWYNSLLGGVGQILGGKIKADATVATSKNISDSVANLVKVLAFVIGLVAIIRIFKK